MPVAARRYANPDTLGVVAAPHTPSEVTVARILLAEDDPDIRHPVIFTLGRADLHVDAFSDGFTALGPPSWSRPTSPCSTYGCP